jgi:hypothetical protein
MFKLQRNKTAVKLKKQLIQYVLIFFYKNNFYGAVFLNKLNTSTKKN